jgi:Leucine-rich repeat (LRR) protein
MNYNKFTRVDVLRSRSLKKLYLNNNCIKQLKISNNYPALVELSLINNLLEVLDFTALELPHLETLDVSNNKICRIITKRTANPGSTDANPVTLPNFKTFTMSKY